MWLLIEMEKTALGKMNGAVGSKRASREGCENELAFYDIYYVTPYI
jgi:hypothetical protein